MNINVKPEDSFGTPGNFSNRPARRRGRPALSGSDTAQDRREDILQASNLLFFQEGYTRTTLRRVARVANVNVALIHYYFGNKQGLYQEVLSSAFATTFASLRGFKNSVPVLTDLVRLMTTPLLDHAALARALLYPDGPAEALAEVAAIKRRLNIHLCAALQTMQRTGHLCTALDVGLLTTTLLDLSWEPIRHHLEGLSTEGESSLTLAQRQINQNTILLETATRP